MKRWDSSRREFVGKVAMGAGLVLACGALAVEGLAYLLPTRWRPRTRLIYAGRLDSFARGAVTTLHDLDGKPVLVRRGAAGLRAYNSTCPHLGCRVQWLEDAGHFLCPCHNGIFDGEGVATSGPPADAGQRLAEVPLKVDETGVVYLEVPDPEKEPGGRTA